MDMDIKISVIIPAYNVGKYVSRCLESIINQTLKEIEIIVINDGSNDNTENEIQKFFKLDSRIIYICQKNIGLGKTRNKGIQIARGEYIAFIDSDDYIELNMLEILYNNAKKYNSDVVCGQVIIEDDQMKRYSIRKIFDKLINIEINDYGFEKFIRNYYFTRYYSHNAWDKIYKSELLKSNCIFFGDNKRIFAEDNYFQLQLFEHASSICFVDENILLLELIKSSTRITSVLFVKVQEHP